MSRLVQGYASVFGNVDSYGEVVDPGAFAGWIQANPQKQIPLLWMHDSRSLPIGLTTGISEDAFGLKFQADLADSVLGQDVAMLIESGAVRSSSFAYKTTDEYLEDEVWHLSGLDLIEISAVTTSFGANSQAYIELVPEDTGQGQAPAPKATSPGAELTAAEITAIFAKHWRR